VKGLAQYIFSEFCRADWSDRPRVNVGDDWGLETLAWTKMSYRPVEMLRKFVLRKTAVAAALELEHACFSADVRLKKRQLQYLQQRRSAVFFVAEQGDAIVGEGIALVRQHKTGRSGRIYSLAVRQQHRGRRIGQKLLQAMLAALSERGVNRVYLEVEQANEAALRLYSAHGFRPIGALPDYYGPTRPGVHMMAETGRLQAITSVTSKSV
jgi:ribosomal protein S18 acetylase RimI-like enzyme